MSVKSSQTDSPELKNYKLDRIRNAAQACGNPQLGRPSILVAGTNAKGSIVAYLSALFQAAGKKVGSYYSPHIVAREERIQVNREWIAPGAWERIVQEHSESFADLSYFENATLVAWLYFREQKVDLQILEVGMGGRLDATNITAPDLSIIGPIGMDHAEILGDSLAKISAEKAGIMRKQKPVWILEPQDPSVFHCLVQEADQREALLRISSSADSEAEERIVDALKLRGLHQVQNALLAYRAYVEFSEIHSWPVVTLNRAIEALSQSSLSGRIQILRKDPLWILDGAHNPPAVAALAEWLKKSYPQKLFEIVFGLMSDKDLPTIAATLAPFARGVHMASFYPEREHSPMRCAQVFEGLGIKTRVYPDICKLVDSLDQSHAEVLVCGSFYLVGEVLKVKRP